MHKEKILLFIPMYNCERQIIRVLKQLDNKVCQFINMVVIVNNRSTDNGEQAVQNYLDSHQLSVPVQLLRNQENYGLGGSHKVAFQYALAHGFDYIIVLHGDDQGDIHDLFPYLKRGIYKQYDCLLGARFMRGSKLNGYSKLRTIGNYVYNILFSIGTRKRIYDLGSGLNMYKADIFKRQFYVKYKDDLMFNYCMVLGSAYYGHSIRFFPVGWREEDQVSNVKMMGQAVGVLKLLAEYAIHKRKFLTKDHRDKIIDEYKAEIVFQIQ